MLYLVVHCEAQSDPNAFPDALTEAGEAQAEHLAKVLNLLGVQNVFSFVARLDIFLRAH